MAAQDMTGKKFGKLTVLQRAQNNSQGTAMWLCICECGNQRLIAGTAIRAGRNKSCGCASPRFISSSLTTHGMSQNRVYKIWLGMMARCSNKASGKSRHLYYDKGIRVCERWTVFENFLEDMGIPQDWETLDRIDGTKGYEKDNCRWATMKVQANNTISNRIVFHDGLSMTVAQWSDKTGIKANTIIYRLRRGWEPSRALSIDAGNKNVLRKLARTKNCQLCGAAFIPRTTQLKIGHGKYCSQKCNGIFRKTLLLSG